MGLRTSNVRSYVARLLGPQETARRRLAGEMLYSAGGHAAVRAALLGPRLLAIFSTFSSWIGGAFPWHAEG